MRRILSKNKLRQLQLLEMLGTGQKGRTMDELAKHFHVTRQTINRDFDYINKAMESAEIVEDHGYYRAIFMQESTIQTIYNEILRDDSAFQLFEVIFYDEDLSVEDVSKKINASTSTVYKMVENIREPLNDFFNLGISTRPVRLVGRETDIRSFYNQYFSEKYNHFTLKMDLPMPQKAFEMMIELGSDLVGMDFMFTYQHFCKIAVGVNLIRYLQGHYLEREFKDLTPYIESFRANEELREKIETAFPGELTDFAIYQLFGQFAFKHYFYTQKEYQQAVKDNQLLHFSQSILAETVQTIEQDFHIPCPNPDELYWKMHKTANQAEMDYLAIPLLNNRKENFTKNVQKMYPELFDYIHSRLELFCKLMNVRCNKQMCNHFTFSFYTLWEEFIPSIMRLMAPVKVLVVSHYEIYHAKMIRDMLKGHFCKRIDVRVYTAKDFDIDHLLAEDYEVLVSNFKIVGLDERPFVLIKDFLHPEDFEHVYESCKQVLLEKYLQ